jgi:hypothetical protein
MSNQCFCQCVNYSPHFQSQQADRRGKIHRKVQSKTTHMMFCITGRISTCNGHGREIKGPKVLDRGREMTGATTRDSGYKIPGANTGCKDTGCKDCRDDYKRPRGYHSVL